MDFGRTIKIKKWARLRWNPIPFISSMRPDLTESSRNKADRCECRHDDDWYSVNPTGHAFDLFCGLPLYAITPWASE